ncbi:hypothetical protein [Clostridium botulinum]|uniref:hypothetical protein n=1 Tax=Clostridium botulinum TaxID=1491 RepID=UPI003DA48C99
MKINNEELYNYLIDSGIRYLYHANSVTTACTYIKQGGLLSRGAVEEQGLIQTSQNSDYKDKKYGVWFDIFLDTVDLHELFKGPNFYGPVLFMYSIDVLIDDLTTAIWITKDNPTNWYEEQTLEDRYFKNVLEYKKLRLPNPYKKMIIIKNIKKPLNFDLYLKQIILDDPRGIYYGVNFYDKAEEKLINAMISAGMDTKLLKKRICNNYCKCFKKYHNNFYSEFFLNKMFL